MSSNIYFKVSMNMGTPSSPIWVEYQDTMGLISGQNSTQLTLSSAFFASLSTLYMKIEYIAEIYTNHFLTAVGLSGIMVKINEPPTGGTCYLNAYNGTALSTVFTITCLGWTDPDGTTAIPNYEFYARYPSSPIRMTLASNGVGVLTMQFPPGLDTDSYMLEISVDIIDEGQGLTAFVFPTYVQVSPDLNQTSNILAQLNSFDPESTFIQQLRGGNLQVCAQNVISLSSMIKDLPMPATLSGLPNATVRFLYFLTSTKIPFKIFSTILKAEFNNQKAIARQLMMQSVKNLSISSMSGVKVISTLVHSVTDQVDEINRETAVSI